MLVSRNHFYYIMNTQDQTGRKKKTSFPVSPPRMFSPRGSFRFWENLKGCYMVKKDLHKIIIRPNSVSTSYEVAFKSPSFYYEIINRLIPEWGRRILEGDRLSSLEGASLWAAAVSVSNACRISEVLRITPSRVQENGLAWTTGSKGSNARLLFIGALPKDMEQIRTIAPEQKLFPVEYIDVYHACVKRNLVSKIDNHVNQAVTHAGRYKLAQSVSASASLEVAGQILGHKSKGAILYYAEPKASKKNVSKMEAKRKLQDPEYFINLLIEKELQKQKEGQHETD